jgi:hypothetical protein
MAQVFRVEHKVHGCGPYRPRSDVRLKDEAVDNLADWLCGRHACSYLHPVPRNILMDEVCGFADLDGLLEWFDATDRERLAAAGYYITVYEVDSYEVDIRQILFCKRNATLVNTLEVF